MEGPLTKSEYYSSCDRDSTIVYCGVCDYRVTKRHFPTHIQSQHKVEYEELRDECIDHCLECDHKKGQIDYSRYANFEKPEVKIGKIQSFAPCVKSGIPKPSEYSFYNQLS